MPDTAAPTANNPATTASARQPVDAYARLDGQRLYCVSGKDPIKFLHGQLSQSLEEVTEHQSRRAAACNSKGRTYALTLLSEYKGDILLRLPDDIADDIISQLNKFLMLFRGTNMTHLEDAVVYGLWGKAAAAALSADAANLETAGDALTMDDGKLIRVQDTAEGCARFEYWRTAGDRIPAQGEPATERDWAAAEISAGLAELSPTSQGQYVPQMLNLQHVDGIHFKKGCYTGQEVIARMHYLGQLKKSLFRLTVTTVDPVIPGTPVIAADKVVGEVVNAVRFDDGHVEALAVIKHAAMASTDWRLEGQTAAVERLPLSYQVPEQSQA